MLDWLSKYYNMSGCIIILLNFMAVIVFFFNIFELDIPYIRLIALLLLLLVLQSILFICGILFGREKHKAIPILKVDLLILAISISIVALSFVFK